MADFIFPSGSYVLDLMKLTEKSEHIKNELFRRLGVQPSNEVITMIVIAKNHWDGYDVLRNLQIECEQIYHKRIDVTKIKSVVLSSLELASKSPHLERANFIIILDENLLGAENYPELEKILPFME